MQLDQTTLRAGTVAFALLAPLAAHAALVAPSGLATGQGYRLAFLTQGGINATSSSIGAYNGFAAAQAALNADLGGLSWTAIASTTATSAADNVSCAGCNDVPIFLVDGTRVATSTVALFATNLINAIDVDQFGLRRDASYAWTGSNAAGTAKTTTEGSNALGSFRPNFGVPYRTDGTWLDGGDYLTAGNAFSIYAISSEVFVGASAAVPEPATLVLLGTGGLLALGTGRRRARRRAAA